MPSHRTSDLIRFVTEPAPCPYLAEESAQLEYRVPSQLDQDLLESLIERGWRRFGNYVFRPQCSACRKCRPLRIVLDEFRPSKSQRRTLRRNQNVELSVTRPHVTDAHVELFNAYHRDMTNRRKWPDNLTSFQDYYDSFIGGQNEFAAEFQYRDAGRLIGVGIVDVLRNGLSSAYFYHDPAWRKLGPGTFSILKEIEWAKAHSLKYSYLGYWIHENLSMDYKARFEPHDILEDCVDTNESPNWQRLPTIND
ncbi:MAG: arginyltransferase [Planctomycetota bacterium]|nr:arginyltransferase [Planctomycetota bacterium]MDA1161486.1 arginyltransferase [Planctomycetota bacterium]